MAGEFQQPSQEPNANDKKQAPIILINLWEKGRRQWENNYHQRPEHKTNVQVMTNG